MLFWMGVATVAIVIILLIFKTVLVFPGLFKVSNHKFDMEAENKRKNCKRKSQRTKRNSNIDKSTQCAFPDACMESLETDLKEATEDNFAGLFPPCYCTQSKERMGNSICNNSVFNYLTNPNNSYQASRENSSIRYLPSATSDCGDSGFHGLASDELSGARDFQVKLQAVDDECVIIVRSKSKFGVIEPEPRKLGRSPTQKMSCQIDDCTCQTELPFLNDTETDTGTTLYKSDRGTVS